MVVDVWLVWSMVALVAAAAFGGFGAAVVRLFSRRAQARVQDREATAFDVRAITAFARQRPVSFFAPDEDGLQVRFALHMTSDGAAVELPSLLRRGAATRRAVRSSRSV